MTNIQKKMKLTYSQAVKAVRAADHMEDKRNKAPTADREAMRTTNSNQGDNRKAAESAGEQAVSLHQLLAQLTALITLLVNRLAEMTPPAVNFTSTLH